MHDRDRASTFSSRHDIVMFSSALLWVLDHIPDLTQVKCVYDRVFLLCSNMARKILSQSKCDIDCQITSNNILPARVFWEYNQTRIAALLSVKYTVNIRAVLPR